MGRTLPMLITYSSLKSGEKYDHSSCIADTKYHSFTFAIDLEPGGPLETYIVPTADLYKLVKRYKEGNPCLFCS
jgi:hypothetical protein